MLHHVVVPPIKLHPNLIRGFHHKAKILKNREGKICIIETNSILLLWRLFSYNQNNERNYLPIYYYTYLYIPFNLA